MIFLKLGTREGVIDDVVSGGAQVQFPTALYIYSHSSILHLLLYFIQQYSIHIGSLLDNSI